MCLAGDESFLQLKGYLNPLSKKSSVLMDGVPTKDLPAQMHEVGKRKTQRIERKHLRLRTRIKRLARRTICFSKSEATISVIGLFINRYEFGISI